MNVLALVAGRGWSDFTRARMSILLVQDDDDDMTHHFLVSWYQAMT